MDPETRGPNPGRVLWGLTLSILFIATLAAGVTTPPDPLPAASPLPFDPPDTKEQQRAAEIALADPDVQAKLGDRYVLTGVALGTQKTPGVPVRDLPRLLDVWFYDYNSDSVVWAVVDPTRAEVTDLSSLEFPYQPPLAHAEIERARELALGLEAVASRFPDPLPVTTMLVHGERTACPENRCVAVAFIEQSPVMDFLVLVNLSQDRALRVLDGPQEVHQ